MPVLHVGADAETAPDDLLVRVAAAVARALGLGPADVLVRRTTVLTLDATGAEVGWATVVVQGRDRGAGADRAVAAAVRAAWPDDRLSVGALRDLP